MTRTFKRVTVEIPARKRTIKVTDTITCNFCGKSILFDDESVEKGTESHIWLRDDVESREDAEVFYEGDICMDCARKHLNRVDVGK